MLNRIRLLVLAITAAMLAGLIYISITTSKEKYDNLLFAAPQNQGTTGSPSLIEDLEELNLESFMLTYEILENKQVSSELTRTGCVVKWTNFTYPYVCGFNMLNGGFFTQSAQEQQIKSAVLNELSAFDLFGGSNIIGNQITIEGASYTITGVINDHDTENSNVYLPSTLQTKGPSAIMALLHEAAVSEYVKNEFKDLGITDTSHVYYDLGLISGLMTDRTIISYEAIICAILIFVFKKSFYVFRDCHRELAQLYKYNSMGDIIRQNPGCTIKAGVSGLFMALGASGFLWLISNIADRLLAWGTFTSDIESYVTDFFSGKLDIIQKYSGVSSICFVAFIVFLIIDVILYFDTSSE